jgi:hypothetical protein
MYAIARALALADDAYSSWNSDIETQAREHWRAGK